MNALRLAFAVALVACGTDHGRGTTGTTASVTTGVGGGRDAGYMCPPPDHWTCCRNGAERAPTCDADGLHCLAGWQTGDPGTCPAGTASSSSSTASGTGGGPTSSASSSGTGGAASSASASGTGGAPCNCYPLCCGDAGACIICL